MNLKSYKLEVAGLRNIREIIIKKLEGFKN